VAGRRFRAEKLDGPWRFATAELPDDFKEIPPDHPAADVLSLVPGTPQAQEAVIRGHIPQTARVAPEWKEIEGTSLAYAATLRLVAIPSLTPTSSSPLRRSREATCMRSAMSRVRRDTSSTRNTSNAGAGPNAAARSCW
jgi:hypothetical protein